MWKPADALPLDSSQRPALEALVRSGKTPQRVAARALIVLAAAEGRPINAIAQEFGVSRPTVYLWRDRFEQAGVLGLVKDAPRPGRRPALTPKRIAQVVDATLHTTPPDATYWSVRTMAKAQGLSHAVVHRIWRAHGLQPHRVETFKLSRDPDFVKKLRDVARARALRRTAAGRQRRGEERAGPQDDPRTPRPRLPRRSDLTGSVSVRDFRPWLISAA